MMNAEEFYETFRKHFSREKNQKVREVYNETEVSPTEWTNLMVSVLKIVASEKGFSREKEVPIASGRVDEKWKKGTISVFIEHENNGNVEDLMNKEVRNLFNSDGDLRILITYFDEKKAEEQDRLKSGILDKLINEKRGRNFEFLLVIGKNEMLSPDDWKAFLYRPTFEYEPIITEAEVNL